ncbi:MAG TPA: phenylalanine--tRNA ligase subunit beta [Streptosporangiaceae bacterium]|nr:phenylalanine--tRNA ligase subunit beta [Streptosporangiaceae bacterium]
MRLPLSWLLTEAGLDHGRPDTEPAEVARRLTAAGLEVEAVQQAGHDITGVVVAEVTGIEELTGFKKPVRYCQVTTGDDKPHNVICGAVNFAVGDRVPLAQPGARLPGGFEIGAKKAYGRMSEGMICSAAELAIGDDHSGILVLPPDAPLGADFVAYAGLADHVLDITVTPDRGYALSIRGVARELATSYGLRYADPADAELPADPGAKLPSEPGAVSAEVHAASIEDPTACDRFVLREVRGFNLAAATPLALRVRLARAGLRSVSLAVDITNYLMLELGQPLHAFDADKLTGPIVVRRARAGEWLETLDHVVRELDPEDIVIADSSGPISLAGTMGGLATEISESSTNLVIEAAHFDARGIARMSRRHKLFSEASYRFERGVDRELPLRASARAASMLGSLGGATVVPGCTHASVDVPEVSITMAVDHPDKVAGTVYGRDAVLRRLQDVGCVVTDPAASRAADDAAAPPGHTPGIEALTGELGVSTGPNRYLRPDNGGTGPSRYLRPDHGKHDRSKQMLAVFPPSWRPDLRYPWDLAEEVIRLEGYENLPVRTPRAAAGRGLTDRQQLRRTTGRALAWAGYVEVLSQPFSSTADHDRLLLPDDDPRRRAPVVANPLNDDEPLLRTTLLPGLLRVLLRNTGRGFADVGLFETGRVFLQHPNGPRTAPILRTDRGPTVHEVATLEAALPDQPLHIAAVMTGERELSGWWGAGRLAGWQDATEAAREVLQDSRVPFEIRAGKAAPWHPGRCAAVFVRAEEGRDWLAGHAGELHPRVIAAFGLPARTAAMELDLSVIETAAAALGPVEAPQISSYPVAIQDVALLVPATVPAADVEAALVAGVRGSDYPDLLEEVRLFDVYTGEQAGAGRKSLAYTLRFRAPDRTLTVEETTAARDAAVGEAARRVGAELRGAS